MIFGHTKQVAPATRLTAETAAAIARTAVTDPIMSPTLTTASVASRDGTLVWTVSAMARGRVPHVEVDDATGAVLSVRWIGLR